MGPLLIYPPIVHYQGTATPFGCRQSMRNCNTFVNHCQVTPYTVRIEMIQSLLVLAE